ncbi:MAG: inositol monophosphatase family protein, partial [Planktomarina sp.]
LPVVDLLFTATKNGGAFLNGDPIQVTTRSQTPGACILASKANFQDKYWPGGFPDIRRSFRSSLAYRLCLVAQGSFDGMLTLRPTWEWDVAAGCLIVEESGGVATDQIGAQTTFNNPTPQLHGIVASNTNIHRDLMAGLT